MKFGGNIQDTLEVLSDEADGQIYTVSQKMHQI